MGADPTARFGRPSLRTIAIALSAVVIVAAVGVVAGVELVTHRAAPKLTVAEVAANVRPSVVTVRVTNYRDGTTEGAGFFFGRGGDVVTSARLFAHATHIDVIGPTGRTSPAALIGIDKTRDVAELATSETKTAPLVAAPNSAAAGVGVVVVGNPYSRLPYTVHQGVVVGTSRQLVLKSQTLTDLIETNVTVDPANIGGAVVDMSGRLVGLIEPGESGHALAVAPAQFNSEVRSWTQADVSIRLGPPLVTRDASSLVLSAVPIDGMPQTKKEKWGSLGIHAVFERPANYDYGSVIVDIYLDVEADESSAHLVEEGFVSNSLGYGFAEVGSTTTDLADEATALQRTTSSQAAYNVAWRDRNVAVDMYLSGGVPTLSPDVTMANLIAVATAQVTAVDTDLAGS